MKDDIITAEFLEEYDINGQVIFDKVLLVGTTDYTSLGRPFVPTAKVINIFENSNYFKGILYC